MNSHIRGLINDTWDDGDPWGCAMNLHFAISDLLHFQYGGTPPEWEYRPGCQTGPVMVAYDPEHPEEGDESYALQMLIDDVLAGLIDRDALRQAGDVLHRYERLLVHLGRDY